LPLGLGLGVVSPDNDAPTLAARPRALLATPETAAIGEVPPELEPEPPELEPKLPLATGPPAGIYDGAASPPPVESCSGAEGPADGLPSGALEGAITLLGRVAGDPAGFAGSELDA
jgi:hypothetical protein